MQKISRAEARAAGLSKYFTGEPCIHGHVDYRYTTSSTCAECLRQHRRVTKSEIAPPPLIPFPPEAMALIARQRDEKSQREAALARLAEIRVWAHAADIDEIRSTAAACCTVEFPVLTPDDVIPRVGPTSFSGVLGQYRVRVPDSYITFIRQLADTLAKRHAPDASVLKAAKYAPLTEAQLRDIFDALKPATV